MNPKLITRALMLCLLLCAACTAAPGPAPTAVSLLEPAPVRSVDILPFEGNVEQITVIAQGELSDPCTGLGEPSIRRLERTFAVQIGLMRLDPGACAPDEQTFSQPITLDVAGLEPDVYTVTVNGVTAIFRLTSAAILPSVTPGPTISTPTLTPTATVTPAPQPAETQAPEEETEEEPAEQEPVTVTPEASATPPPVDDVQQEGPEATASTGAAAGDEAINTDEEACVEKAAFYGDVTVPDGTLFRQGETFVKTWRVRNEGTCTWDERYSLVFAGGEIMDGPISSPLPYTPPGEIAEISVSLTAPKIGGRLTGNWQFQNPAGERFGVGISGQGTLWVQIVVNWIGDVQGPAVCAAERNPAFEVQVAALVNAERRKKNLPALRLETALSEAAFVHSRDMACRSFLDHTGSDGSRWYDRITAQGYAYQAASENIYAGFPAFGGDPPGAVDWWMKSEIHRNNILDPKKAAMGVGYAYYPSSQYGGYYTLVFTNP